MSGIEVAIGRSMRYEQVGDAENIMSPNRAAFLARRRAATKALQARQAARMLAKAAGILPPGHAGHEIEVSSYPEGGSPYDWGLRGLALASGEVHVWADDRLYHASYVSERWPDGDVEIRSGLSFGEDGWAFYVCPDGIQRWCLPEEKVAAVEAVLAAKLRGWHPQARPEGGGGGHHHYEEEPAPDVYEPCGCHMCKAHRHPHPHPHAQAAAAGTIPHVADPEAEARYGRPFDELERRIWWVLEEGWWTGQQMAERVDGTAPRCMAVMDGFMHCGLAEMHLDDNGAAWFYMAAWR